MSENYKSNRGFEFLLKINILTALLLSATIIPDRLIKKLKRPDNFVGLTITQDELLEMNNTMRPIHSELARGTGDALYKVLIIGNSITSQNIANEIGWTHKSGMAATDSTSDYVHLLLDKISHKLPNNKIIFMIYNLASFERNPEPLQASSVDVFASFKPDIIIFQLSENVNDENLEQFQEEYIKLINILKSVTNAQIICTTSFFPSLSKNNMVDSVALKTNSFVVDLSNLSLNDKEKFAINEKDYKGDKSKWKVSGIGMHPGDKGMASIADQLFITMSGIINNNKAKLCHH